MGWTNTAYLRRGPVNWTGAQLGFGTPSGSFGWSADTSACWYEVSYGLGNGQALVNAQYKFVYTGGGSATGTMRANLPVTPLAMTSVSWRPVGCWYSTVWFGWGGDGLCQIHDAGSGTFYLEFLRRNASAAQVVMDDTNYTQVMNVANASDVFVNIQYEAAQQ